MYDSQYQLNTSSEHLSYINAVLGSKSRDRNRHIYPCNLIINSFMPAEVLPSTNDTLSENLASPNTWMKPGWQWNPGLSAKENDFIFLSQTSFHNPVSTWLGIRPGHTLCPEDWPFAYWKNLVFLPLGLEFCQEIQPFWLDYEPIKLLSTLQPQVLNKLPPPLYCCLGPSLNLELPEIKVIALP